MLPRFENYLRFERQLSEVTTKSYLRMINQFKKFLTQDILNGGDLNKANRQDVSSFLASLRDKNAVSSISLFIVALRCYYKWAYYFFKGEDLGQLSFFLNNIIKLKRVRGVIPIPTRDEVVKLRSVLSQYLKLNSWNKDGRPYRDTLRAYAIIELLITAGLRSKELRDLCRQDVDLENRTIFIRSGKGGHQRISLFGESAVNVLIEYFEINKFYPEQKIFSVAQYNVIYRTVKLWAAKAQINPNVYTHSFRHYFITESQRLGVKIQDVADQVGHRDLNTTRNYTHLNIGYLQDVYKDKTI